MIEPTSISGSEKRKMYFFQVIFRLLIGSCYFFALSNFLYQRPLSVVLYNFCFGVFFTFCYPLRHRHFDSIIIISAIGFQAFIFGHAFFLLPGKQLEAGLGILTCILPIFMRGFRLWFFFTCNFILYHIVLFSVAYERFFFAQYLFYIVIFIIIRAVLNENVKYERELMIQRDKIRRDAESLKTLDELKTRFFANISHELRTPLTLLLSPIQNLLSHPNLSEKQRTYLQLMDKNGQKLRRRINELLELSRLDANKVELNYTAVAIHQLGQQIVTLHEGIAQLNKIALSYESQIAEDIYLQLDAAKVEMILSNFLSNALKFTPAGGQIILRISQQVEQLQIEVSDTGIGIPKENLTTIFARFQQVKHSTYYEGTGIGLALCKELAELQQGKVWAESSIGNGSTFYLQLPYVETDAVPISTALELTQPTKILAPTPNLNKEITEKPSVLIVEDNADLRQYMELTLSEKYKILTAENGQVAMDFLTTQNTLPNLILTDLMMPIMDGKALIQKVKSTDELRTIPIIVLTAQQAVEVKIETLRIGIDDYLTKPFVEKELLARVDNLIANAQERKRSITMTNTTTQKSIAQDPTLSAADLEWLKNVEEKILAQISNGNFKTQ